MAENRIIMTDSRNVLLPLAWGVAGGNLIGNNLSIDKSLGSEQLASVGIFNANFNASAINGTFNVSVKDVAIYGQNYSYLGSQNDILISAGNTIQTTATNRIALGSSNVTVSTGNFYVGGTATFSGASMIFSTGNFFVSGPANFVSPVNFSSSVNIFNTLNVNGPIWFNDTQSSSCGIYTNLNTNSSFYIQPWNAADNVTFKIGHSVWLDGDVKVIPGSSNINNLNVHTDALFTGNTTFVSPTLFSSNVNFTYNTYFNGGTVTGNNIAFYLQTNGKTEFGYTPHRIGLYGSLNTVINSGTSNTNTASLYTNATFINIGDCHTIMNASIMEINGATKLTINNSITNTDTATFTKLQYLNTTPVYTFSNSTTITLTEGTFTNIITVPITQTIDLTQLNDCVSLGINLYHNTSSYDQSEYGTLYIEVYDTVNNISSGKFLIDDQYIIRASTLPLLRVPLTRFNDYNLNFHTITQLNSNYVFNLWGNAYSDYSSRSLTATIGIYDTKDLITDTLDNLTFKKITQSAYDALVNPDSNTLYVIVG